MTFLDYQPDAQLGAQQGNPTEGSTKGPINTAAESSEFFLEFPKEKLSSWLSKERIMEMNSTEHRQAKNNHFFNEFPRKQSNNDLQYHTDDTVMSFLADYFFISKKK